MAKTALDWTAESYRSRCFLESFWFKKQKKKEEDNFYREPMLLRPRTTPTPMMWPTLPHAKVSARVKPAGSPVCNPESLASSFSPAVDFLFADGANPNRPANSIRLVDITIICFNRHVYTSSVRYFMPFVLLLNFITNRLS